MATFYCHGLCLRYVEPSYNIHPNYHYGAGIYPIEANLFAAIESLLTLPIIFLFAWLSDKTNKRGLTVMIAISVYLVALVILRVLVHHVDKWGKFALWTAVNALAVGYHPIHNAWIQVNCRSPTERSISVA